MRSSGRHVWCLPGARPGARNWSPQFGILKPGVLCLNLSRAAYKADNIWREFAVRFRLPARDSRHGAFVSLLVIKMCARGLPKAGRACLWEGQGARRSDPKVTPTPWLTGLAIRHAFARPLPKERNSNGRFRMVLGAAGPGKAVWQPNGPGGPASPVESRGFLWLALTIASPNNSYWTYCSLVDRTDAALPDCRRGEYAVP